MKTTKYIILALTALFTFNLSVRAQYNNTLTLQTVGGGTVMGLDMSDPSNQPTVLNALFTDASDYTSGAVATSSGGSVSFVLHCQPNVKASNIGVTLIPQSTETMTSTPDDAAGTLTVNISGITGDASHYIAIAGYTSNTISLSLADPTQVSGTEQGVELTVTDDDMTLTYTSTSSPDISAYFNVTGNSTASTAATQTVTVTGKNGTPYAGQTKSATWDPFTKVLLPAYDWDGDAVTLTNAASFPATYGHTADLDVNFIFPAAYYGKLATFTFANSYNSSATYTPSASTFDAATNTWSFTLPETARAIISNATFSVTKRPLTDANVTAELTGYLEKSGDVYLYSYTGSNVTPTISIVDNERTYDLVLTTDYTAGGDLTKDEPGLYTINLEGAGYNYTGTKDIQWRIIKDINHEDFTVTVDPVVYKHAEYTLDDVKNKVTVMHKGTKLTEGTDYDLTLISGHQKFEDAKTYVNEIVITGKITAGIYGSRLASFTISPKDISLTTVTAETAYTGSVIDPAEVDGTEYKYVKVLDGTNPVLPDLGTGGDFTMTVKADTYKDAGTYTNAITLTAHEGGNYTGSKTVDFIISSGTSINDIAITVTVDPVVYKGTEYTLDEIKAKVVVKNGSTDLVEGTDYELTKLSTIKDAKTYANNIIITGKGMYFGTRTADFIVNAKDFQLCTIVAGATYDGNTIAASTIEANTPTVYVTVKDGTTTLTVGTDYTISANTSYIYRDAGTYEDAITVSAVEGGNYTGFKVVDFVIAHNDYDIANALIIAKDTYTSAPLPPTAENIKVILGNKELTYGTEYTFIQSEVNDYYVDAKTYENALTIVGIGAYYGITTSAYVIQPRAFDDEKITIYVDEPTKLNELQYNDADQALASLIKVRYNNNDPAIPATNYSFTPASVKEAGTYTISFEGKYNLTGTKDITVKVLKSLSGTYTDQFVINTDPIEQPFIYDGTTPVTPAIVVKDNGNELTLGKDYTVAYSDNEAEGEGTITITGAGVYSGTKTQKYSIIANYITVSDYTYHVLTYNTVAVGTAAKTVATTKTDNNLTVTDKVTRTIGATNYDFNVVGVEEGAFKNLTTMYTLTLPATITFIEDKAFVGCTALRWIDAHTAAGFLPSSLDRTIENTPFYGVPAQSLVFLTDNSVKGENYIYYVGTDDYRCYDFKIYDDVSGTQTNFTQANGYEWAYENPYTFKANKVTNTRQFKAGQHYTTCLPYSMPIPENVKAYQLEASSNNTSGNDLIGFVEVTGTLEAFKPYVLIPENSGQQLGTEETTIPTTVGVYTDATAAYLNKTPASTVGGYNMFGTMRFKAGDGKQYIMQDKNVWKLTDGAGWNSGTGACVLPMRAYISKEDEHLVKPYLNADYTNIKELNELFDEATPVENGTRYDLAGRKLGNGKLQKGIFIVNGKKVAVGK